MPRIKIGILETIEMLNQSGKNYFEPYRHGTLEVGMYRPAETDPQQPHDKDEVYVILHGSGKFICGGNTVTFEPGDVLFVPANTEHRFVDFTENFLTWVIFYGRKGGEGD